MYDKNAVEQALATVIKELRAHKDYTKKVAQNIKQTAWDDDRTVLTGEEQCYFNTLDHDYRDTVTAINKLIEICGQ